MAERAVATVAETEESRGLAAAEREVVATVAERVAAPVGARGLAAAEREVVATVAERVEAERVAVERGLEVVETVVVGSAKVEKAVAMVRVD